jgi:peptidoglycan/xylan/chitin deacetylase (PgdA/CDA1 family)
MARIALKVDVDTERGTREGVPRIAALFERLGVHATFLFSLGPDHTGRAIRRVFRRGFVGKVRRTSVLQHYGLRTVLYGTLLPGPHIGRRHAGLMRSLAERGFEVGVHTYDHTRWQDGVMDADEAWTRREILRAQAQFTEIFGTAAKVHGAAGWQLNLHVPDLEYELGFHYASDVRGATPFMPVIHGLVSRVPQLPTTLPTLDELIGVTDLSGEPPVEHLASLTRASHVDQVYTLHAELEGGAYLHHFERLLQRWQAQGHELCDLATQFASLDPARLPRHEIAFAAVAGRAGVLATQGPPCRG